MSGSINKVILVGRLGGDPQSVTSGDGNLIVKFALATSENWTDKNTGERKERTEWHRIVIFDDKIAKFASDYCVKGSLVYLEAQVQTRKWDDNGTDRYTTEIVLQRFKSVLKLLDSKKDKPQDPPPEPPKSDIADDIPF